jgi:hypothetical protein
MQKRRRGTDDSSLTRPVLLHGTADAAMDFRNPEIMSCTCLKFCEMRFSRSSLFLLASHSDVLLLRHHPISDS